MSKHRGCCEASIARVYSERVSGREGLVSPGPVCNETGVIGRSKSYVVNDPNIHRLFVNVVLGKLRQALRQSFLRVYWYTFGDRACFTTDS